MAAPKLATAASNGHVGVGRGRFHRQQGRLSAGPRSSGARGRPASPASCATAWRINNKTPVPNWRTTHRHLAKAFVRHTLASQLLGGGRSGTGAPVPHVLKRYWDAGKPAREANSRRRPNSQPASFRRHDGAGFQFGAMGVEYSPAYRRLLSGRKVDQAKDSAMRMSKNESELAEVLVQRHQDSTFTMSNREDRFIPRVLLPIARPDDIVSGSPQLRYGATPDTRIEEELHSSPATTGGSTRSWPTRRCA